MPKKHSKKKQDLAASTESLGSFYSADDSASVASDISSTVSSLANSVNLSADVLKTVKPASLANEVAILDTVVSALDDLLEKRSSKRIDGLSKLIALFSLKYVGPMIESRTETIIDALFKCLVKRDDEEMSLAARLIALLYAQLGPSEDLYRRLSKILVDFLRAQIPQRSHACVHAVNSLALLGAMENMDSYEVGRLLTILLQIIDDQVQLLDFGSTDAPRHLLPRDGLDNFDEQKPFKELLVASLKGYGLILAEKIDLGSVLEPELVDNLLDKNFLLLYSDDLATRVAAGQNIALLASYFYSLKDTERVRSGDFSKDQHGYSSSDHETSDSSVEEPITTTNSTVAYTSIAQLQSKLQAMSVESNKHTNKKDKQRQKSEFRQVYKAVQMGEMPLVKLKFKSQTVYFDSWVKIKQLVAVRELFGEGLSMQLVENPHVQSWLRLTGLIGSSSFRSYDNSDNEGQGGSGMSDFDKRQSNKVKSKERYKRSSMGRKSKMSEMYLLSSSES